MKMNRIQLQAGLIVNQFLNRYGTDKHYNCRKHQYSSNTLGLPAELWSTVLVEVLPGAGRSGQCRPNCSLR